MDTELIIYLIFIAFAILSRFLKKKKEDNAPPQADSMDETSQRPSQKQMTFEELLREFTGEQQPQPQPQPKAPARETIYESYEDEPSWDSRVSDDEAKETYSRSVREAKKLKTLDELVDLDQPISSGHFKGYEIEEEENIADDILHTLQDADGARKAIILSEIINRKY